MSNENAADTKAEPETQLNLDADIHDRVVEAYYGKMGEPLMRSTHNRVHWICERVLGDYILDVGCSQGIVSILLAREGKKVVGIDSAEKSIEQARSFLAQDPRNVQEQVSLVHGNFLKHGFGKERFDTVVMAELLEHIIKPADFVARAAQVLKDKGRLIVTVPFGINDFIDHKHTFYVLEPLRLLHGLFAVEEIEVLGKWVGFVATKRKTPLANGAEPTLDRQIMTSVEQGFLKAERSLVDEVRETRKKAAAFSVSDLAGLRERFAQAEGKLQATERLAQQAEDFLSSTMQALKIEREKNALHLSEKSKELDAAKNELNEIKAESVRLRGDVLQLEKDSVHQKAESDRLQETLAQLELEKRRLEEESSGLREKLEKADKKNIEYEFSLKNKEDSIHNLTERIIASGSNEKSLRQKLESARQEISKTEKDKLSSIEGIKSTLSFQLGYTLLHAPKSFHGMLSLPGDLLRIRKEAKIRKTKKKARKKALVLTAPKAAPDNGKTRILTILDEFSWNSFSKQFQAFPISRSNYKKQINTSLAKFALLESCWKGNGGAWEYAFVSPGLKHQNAQALLEVLQLLKNKGIPIVFWNKEDPMHYERFLPIAKHADIVLTTDSNRIPFYEKDLPNTKIGLMPFAAEISICNPMGRFRIEQGSICFAGAYYGENHDERKRQMDELLPVIPAYDGVIYDRMSNLKNERYFFPEQYRPYIRDAVPFKDIVNVYKSFKLFLNVNTIVDSPTMMSRRVYELLASGTPVISSPSKALEEQFPGIVQIASTAAEAKRIAGELLEDEWKWLRLSHQGYREVMQKHTYEKSASIIESSAGVNAKDNPLGQKEIGLPPLVSIVVATKRPEMVEQIISNIKIQTHQRLEVVCVLTKDFTKKDMKHLENNLPNCKVLSFGSDVSLGDCLNAGFEKCNGDYLVKLDDDNIYGPNFILDLLMPFYFTEAAIVGKKCHFVYLKGSKKLVYYNPNQIHSYTDFVAGDAMMFRRELFEKVRFPSKRVGEDTKFLNDAKELGYKIYTADPFNYIKIREAEQDKHTWIAEDELFLRNGKVVSDQIDKELAFI